MIQNERASRHEHVLDVARQMMTAARTAPKGKGVDIIEKLSPCLYAMCSREMKNGLVIPQ